MDNTIDNIPEDIRNHILSLGKVEWGSISKRSDEQHILDFANTLKLTREYFDNKEITTMEGVYLKDTEVVVCHTGTSPKAFLTARILTALWNKFYDENIKHIETSVTDEIKYLGDKIG